MFKIIKTGINRKRSPMCDFLLVTPTVFEIFATNSCKIPVLGRVSHRSLVYIPCKGCFSLNCCMKFPVKNNRLPWLYPTVWRIPYTFICLDIIPTDRTDAPIVYYALCISMLCFHALKRNWWHWHHQLWGTGARPPPQSLRMYNNLALSIYTITSGQWL